jgi:hypothetical protein
MPGALKGRKKEHECEYGHTTAELIVERADSTKDKMGFTTWRNAPKKQARFY